MRIRDSDDCAANVCRETLLGLVFTGQVPNERHLEMLLDRLERERPVEPRRGEAR